MKVMVIGSGGREHTILWKLSQSSRITELYCAPGNGGISEIARLVDIKVTDIEGIVRFSKEKALDLVVVAPEGPLADGMVDALEAAGIRAFGPVSQAAMIESSKAFSKALMAKYGIPTADYSVFSDSEEALDYVRSASLPLVLKADGLAAGKGVLICETREAALDGVRELMEDKKFGSSGSRIVIEEFMTGPEVSVLAFTDGKTLLPMVSAQDHKRAFDNDQGLNTGGMGTFSPSRVYTDALAQVCMETIYLPTLEALNREGRTFKGIIYFGLMLTPKGPKVVEYNARFGDPETQVVLTRLKTDLLDVFEAVVDEKLHTISLEWRKEPAVCVIMASGGYPEEYDTGFEITGLNEAAQDKEVVVFHAGTSLKEGKMLTAGGRVLGVTAVAPDFEKAREKAYTAVKKIHFSGSHYRTDIGIK